VVSSRGLTEDVITKEIKLKRVRKLSFQKKTHTMHLGAGRIVSRFKAFIFCEWDNLDKPIKFLEKLIYLLDINLLQSDL
jgi:hypothetical protein